MKNGLKISLLILAILSSQTIKPMKAPTRTIETATNAFNARVQVYEQQAVKGLLKEADYKKFQADISVIINSLRPFKDPTTIAKIAAFEKKLKDIDTARTQKQAAGTIRNELISGLEEFENYINESMDNLSKLDSRTAAEKIGGVSIGRYADQIITIEQNIKQNKKTFTTKDYDNFIKVDIPNAHKKFGAIQQKYLTKSLDRIAQTYQENIQGIEKNIATPSADWENILSRHISIPKVFDIGINQSKETYEEAAKIKNSIETKALNETAQLFASRMAHFLQEKNRFIINEKIDFNSRFALANLTNIEKFVKEDLDPISDEFSLSPELTKNIATITQQNLAQLQKLAAEGQKLSAGAPSALLGQPTTIAKPTEKQELKEEKAFSLEFPMPQQFTQPQAQPQQGTTQPLPTKPIPAPSGKVVAEKKEVTAEDKIIETLDFLEKQKIWLEGEYGKIHQNPQVLLKQKISTVQEALQFLKEISQRLLPVINSPHIDPDKVANKQSNTYDRLTKMPYKDLYFFPSYLLGEMITLITNNKTLLNIDVANELETIFNRAQTITGMQLILSEAIGSADQIKGMQNILENRKEQKGKPIEKLLIEAQQAEKMVGATTKSQALPNDIKNIFIRLENFKSSVNQYYGLIIDEQNPTSLQTFFGGVNNIVKNIWDIFDKNFAEINSALKNLDKTSDDYTAYINSLRNPIWVATYVISDSLTILTNLKGKKSETKATLLSTYKYTLETLQMLARSFQYLGENKASETVILHINILQNRKASLDDIPNP